MHAKLLIIFVFSFVLLAGCAAPTTQRAKVDDALVELETRKQKEIALNTQLKAQKRLLRIAYPILEAATFLCEKKVRPDSGFTFANKHSFEEGFQDTAVIAYGMGEALQITQVISNSPAHDAGLKVDDVLVSINGEMVPTGKRAAEELRDSLKESLSLDTQTSITVVRGDDQKQYEFSANEICDYPVLIGEGGEVNAFADGKKIVITKGMMRFAQNDQELALVVAHELAHNVMDHIDAKVQNYLLGSVLDILAAVLGADTQGTFGEIASQAYSKEFEEEADYVGLYLMSRAGLEIDNAPTFWRKMAAEHPASIQKNHASSHPATPERFVSLEKAIEEIQQKINADLPLEPQYKK